MATTILEAEGAAAEAEPDAARRACLRVLIVEDEAIAAICFEEAVHGLGHVVVETADTGRRAVAAAEQHRPDLVLMDVRLRDGTDGVEAANVIRETWGIPSIFITASSDPVTLARTKAARPLIDPLIKPVSPTLIRYALDHAAELLARAPRPHGAADG